MIDKYLETFIQDAIKEDVGEGDHSSLSCIPKDAVGEAQLLIKEKGILAGLEIAKKIFSHIDPSLKFKQFLFDGSEINQGDRAFIVKGNVHSILKAERLVLNIMQRMSGIATTTRKYVNLVNGTNTKILDTRKTTPGVRFLEKQAVKIGGGDRKSVV